MSVRGVFESAQLMQYGVRGPRGLQGTRQLSGMHCITEASGNIPIGNGRGTRGLTYNNLSTCEHVGVLLWCLRLWSSR